VKLHKLNKRCKYRLKYNCYVAWNWVDVEVIFGDNNGIYVGWVDCGIWWRSRVYLNQT